MEFILKAERKPEVEAVLQLLDEMNPTEQKEMLIFMLGVKFAGLGRKMMTNKDDIHSESNI